MAEKEVLFSGNQIRFDDLVAARNTLLQEERALLSFEAEKEVKKVTLKRMLGFDASLNTLNADYSSLDLKLSVKDSAVAKNKKVTASLKGSAEALADVVSVKYSVTNLFKGERSTDRTSNFSKYFKVKKKGTTVITVEILMLNGEVLTRETTVRR